MTIIHTTGGNPHMKGKTIVTTAAAGLLLAVLASGCGKGHGSTASVPSSFGARASALATSTAGQEARALVAKCIPADPMKQAALGHRLLTDTSKHPNGSWAALLACAGVSAQDRQVIEDQALTAAEHVHWTSRASRDAYFSVTLPGIIAQHAGVSPAPVVTR